jgi:hypothetical protein
MAKGIDPSTGKGCRYKDRTGSRNGRLVFLRTLGLDAHRHHLWEAKCDCGATTVTATPHKTKSCGCLHREVAAETQRKKRLPESERLARAKANAVKQRQRRRLDPLAVMQARLSRLHRHALAQVAAIKTSPTFEQLGYTAADFVAHIERQFAQGMGWANMDRWQIDHIVPISEARTIDDVVALNQLSNLRPMWSEENNRKKNKRVSLL